MLEAIGNVDVLSLLEANWRAEMEDESTYRMLASEENDPRRRNALRGLAAAEKYHALLWSNEIALRNGPVLVYSDLPKAKAHPLPSSTGQIDSELRLLRTNERSQVERYSRQVPLLTDAATARILRELIADENEHYKALSALIRARPPLPDLDGPHARAALDTLLAARRKRRPEAVGWLNDAVYAAHDGLGSIFGIVSGVAGATFGKSHFVLIAGLAGMIGSAISTGTGAYLTSKSQRELFDAGILRERQAVDYDEAEAREVLALSLQVRGLPEDVSSRLAHLLAENKEGFIKALARTRDNFSEEILVIHGRLLSQASAPPRSAHSCRLFPFFFSSGIPAIVLAASISLLAHFSVGAAKSLMTVRPWWKTGLELTAFGAVEGIVTYSIGIALGHMVRSH